MKATEFKLSDLGAAIAELIYLEDLEKISYDAPVKSFNETLPPDAPVDEVRKGLRDLENANFLFFVPKKGLFGAAYYGINMEKIAEYFQNDSKYMVKITKKIGFD
ncbi:hypothetical protein HYU07_06355 [Candidatus Woesearchaeota archaeon]|nr:hypothetical protein [Candidatus Woesearchaeota archaeon]